MSVTVPTQESSEATRMRVCVVMFGRASAPLTQFLNCRRSSPSKCETQMYILCFFAMFNRQVLNFSNYNLKRKVEQTSQFKVIKTEKKSFPIESGQTEDRYFISREIHSCNFKLVRASFITSSFITGL